jgi:uncharacterized protein (DUF39 family)
MDYKEILNKVPVRRPDVGGVASTPMGPALMVNISIPISIESIELALKAAAKQDVHSVMKFLDELEKMMWRVREEVEGYEA